MDQQRKNPDLFHGVGAFDIATGQVKQKSTVPSYTSVFGKTLTALGKEDERIVGITAAMGKGTGINLFQEQFPERTVDVGIAEQHAVTMAAAMALDGLKPVVAIYSTFFAESLRPDFARCSAAKSAGGVLSGQSWYCR